MITEVRILPPLGIARLGSSQTPLGAYTLESPEDPLGYRRIHPEETLVVDQETGAILRAETPDKVVFRDGDRIRPVAPFFEVWAREDHDELQPLTMGLLEKYGLKPESVIWNVRAANLKVFRRTGDEKDQVLAETGPINNHVSHPLPGRCAHFLATETVLPLGSAQYIRPTKEFPEIRLRYTPAEGKVYGSATKRQKIDAAGNVVDEDDPVITKDRVIYDASPGRGLWCGWFDKGTPSDTNPGSIYAGFADKNGNQISWGYLDDECDGIISVQLDSKGQKLSAFARFGAGPPMFAPDGLPIRTVADELEQAMFGPEVSEEEVTLEDAENILQRAYETVRLLNTAVMNGNTIRGRTAVASAMPSQDSNDTSRLYSPIMAPTLVDNLAIVALHKSILASLRSGGVPWFADALRQPEEIGDLSDKGRRKMPAMMRGADGRYLTLTRRQIDIIRKAANKATLLSGGGHE
jgi:hypothetical protein